MKNKQLKLIRFYTCAVYRIRYRTVTKTNSYIDSFKVLRFTANKSNKNVFVLNTDFMNPLKIQD